ncbi:MAG: TonB-dependent receptor, partial [Flavitalea sp.]
KPFFSLAPGGNNGFLLIDRTLRNTNLKPEETRSFEAGLDIGLLSNKLSAEITYYKTNTINQVLSIPVPAPSGYNTRIINAGNIQNQGIEALLHVKAVDTKEFKWNINISFGTNANKVLRLDTAQKKTFLSSPQNLGAIVVEDGRKYGEIYTAGFKRNSLGEIVVNNGLPIIENDPSIYAGNYNPDWTGGIANLFQYRSWTFSFLIDIRKGGVIISGTQNLMAAKGISERTLANRGSDFVIPNTVNEDGSKNTVPVNPQAYWQAVSASGGEQFIYDATNARVREASLTYAIPTKYVNASFVKGASLSLIGRNLFFLKNNKDGIDPESALGTGNNQGIEYASIPTTRSLGIYLKLNF